MKKLIATCIIFCCLLIPLRGYGENSAVILVGTGIVGLITVLAVNFIKAEDNEANWANKAWDFHCNNVQLVPGQAFTKYQGYLSVIANFLTKYSFHKNFRNDLKTVFEMSQDDSRLTLSEKQEIADKFTSNYKFLLPEKQIS
jgi:hypothetical protein